MFNLQWVKLIGPFTGFLQASKEISEDFTSKLNKILTGEYFESIQILGPETVKMIQENEDKLWKGVQQIDGVETYLGNPSEKKREKILIKSYQLILVGIDWWRTVNMPDSE